MRVVGGKTGADGRLFAYLVWTVPGGPAEKMGLQQGDKVSIVVASIWFDLIEMITDINTSCLRSIVRHCMKWADGFFVMRFVSP